jgi:hypothetical protein
VGGGEVSEGVRFEFTLDATALSASLSEVFEKYSDVMVKMQPVMKRAAEQISAIAALFNPPKHRSGHRHAGTRDHRLRYTPARKDIPLGLRTVTKARG